VGSIVTQDTSATTITYTHDAWNRLVGVEYGQTVRGSYVYNGLNWRILKQADTDGTGGPDQQRLMHYSDAPGMWQLLEEDVRDDWTAQTPGDIDRHVQYVWGDRYSSEIGDCPELIDVDRHVQYVWGDRYSSEIGDSVPDYLVRCIERVLTMLRPTFAHAASFTTNAARAA